MDTGASNGVMDGASVGHRWCAQAMRGASARQWEMAEGYVVTPPKDDLRHVRDDDIISNNDSTSAMPLEAPRVGQVLSLSLSFIVSLSYFLSLSLSVPLAFSLVFSLFPSLSLPLSLSISHP